MKQRGGRMYGMPALVYRYTLLVLLSSSMLLLGSCVHSKTKLELAETCYNLGNAYSELEKWEKAGDAYLRAMELDSSFKRAGYQMARVYVQAGEYEKAKEQLELLLEEEPRNQSVREHLAWVYARSGRTEEAKTLYRSIIESNPADCDVRYNFALLSGEDGQWEAVRETLLDCVRYESADAEIYHMLGKAKLALDEEGAVGFLEKAYEEDPSIAGLAEDLASAYLGEERYLKTIEIYDEIIEMAEEKERIGKYRFKKAFLYFTAIEDYERGEESLRTALEAGYRSEKNFRKLLTAPRLLDPERIRGIFEDFGLDPEELLENNNGASPENGLEGEEAGASGDNGSAGEEN